MDNLTWMSRPADMMESQKKAQDDMLGMMLQSVEMEVDLPGAEGKHRIQFPGGYAADCPGIPGGAPGDISQ